MNRILIPTVSDYCRNILYVCERCTVFYINEGKQWYANAYFMCQEIANTYALPINSIIGAVAALSPGMKWDRNIEVVEKLIHIHQGNIPLENITYGGTYGRKNYTKAYRILSGEEPFLVLGGNKVRAFYNCISHIFSNKAPLVVLDRHAVAVACGRRLSEGYIKYIGTDKRYNLMSDAYKQVSKLVGLLPHQLQAMVWCKWRDYHAA